MESEPEDSSDEHGFHPLSDQRFEFGHLGNNRIRRIMIYWLL